MTDYDSRFKRLPGNPGVIVINNYKCGFSSSNLLAHDSVTRLGWEDPVILFYRNIFIRVISVFIDFSITDDRYLDEKGWLFKNLKYHLGSPAYDVYLDLLRTGKAIEAFLVFMGVLELIYKMDNHSLPQVAILEYYDVDRIDNFIELENSIAFHRLTDIPFPYEKNNKSDQEIKGSLKHCLKSSERLQSLLRHIYRKDIEFFSGQGIDVAKTQALE